MNERDEIAPPSSKAMWSVLFKELETGPPVAIADHVALSCAWMAQRILELPDMQAIRDYLRAEMRQWCCEECWRTDATTGEPRLPKTVVDWVLS